MVESYALPLPTLVIGELLGVPYEDHDFFQRQSRAVTSLTGDSGETMADRKALHSYLGELRGRPGPGTRPRT